MTVTQEILRELTLNRGRQIGIVVENIDTRTTSAVKKIKNSENILHM